MEYRVTKPYPTIRQAWVLLLILIGIDALVASVYYIIAYILEYTLTDASLVSSFFSEWKSFLPYTIAGVLGLRFAFRKRKLSGITEPLGFKKVSPRIYIAGIIIVLCLGYLGDLVAYILPVPDFLLEFFNDMNEESLLMFITTVVAAPILEELVFRGVMLDGLLRNTTPGKAILTSTLIFAVIHANPWQGVTALLFGLLAGWLYWKTHSLILCIVLHLVNNLTATLFGWYYEGDSFTPIIDAIGITTYLLTLVAAILITIGVMRYLRRTLRKNDDSSFFQHQSEADLPL